MNKSILILLCFIYCMCQADKSEKTIYSDNKDAIEASHLITAHDASNLINQDEEGVRVIYIGKKESYDIEHITNAFQIWRKDYSTTLNDSISGMMASKEQIQNILRSIGYYEDMILLLYDSKANVDAMRFAWMLELHGFYRFKIINGGLKYWKLSGYKTTYETNRKNKPSYYDLNREKNVFSRASFGFVKAALDNEKYVIVDTREEYEFKGEPFELKGKVFKYKKGAYNRGKIPGSVHLNWSQLVDLSGDHRIKSEKDLMFDLDAMGITKDKNVIVYCQSGSRSSNTYFVLNHVLGFPNVKNYDGSWIEWSYMNKLDSDIPIEQLCSEQQFEELYQKLKSE